MTRERAIEVLKAWDLNWSDVFTANEFEQAFAMAISALSEELSEDGTLTVHVSDGSKVTRVFVMGDNIFGGLYYPDSAENKGDLISRQAVLDELEKWDWQDLYLPSHFKQILDDVPSVENKEEWIPVSEENLPEDFQEVLVTVVRCNGTRVVRAAEYHENPSLSRKIFRILENNERWEVGEDGLIAWMPKPEPCKAESEEK